LNHDAPEPYDECTDYLKHKRWNEPKDPLVRRFFAIAPSGEITLEAEVFFFVKRLFWSYLSPGEKARAAPGRPRKTRSSSGSDAKCLRTYVEEHNQRKYR